MENYPSGTSKFPIAAFVVIIIVAAGFAYALTSGLVSIDPSNSNNTGPIVGDDEPLLIVGDEELVSVVEQYGFSGSGISTDPYIIENLSIVVEDSANCIDIRDVESSFLIRNCELGIYSWFYSAIGIYLRNCNSATIENCRLEGGISGIELFECDGVRITNCVVKGSIFGINATISQSPVISNNAVRNCIMGINIGGSNLSEISSNLLYNNSQGITSYWSYYCSADANNVTGCTIGIELGFECGNWTITNNWILNNTDYGIKLNEGTLGILLYSNSLGLNNLSNAIDDGMYNSWDLESEVGNYWDDYSGSGWYSIPGSAESIDHFPQLLEVLMLQ